MKRIFLLLGMLAITLTLATQVGAATAPRALPADECLRTAVFKSASNRGPMVRKRLCGGNLIGKHFLGGGICLYVWDGGPGASPRITAWQGPC